MSLPPSGEIPQGAIRFNTDSQRLEFYAQGEWWVMSTDTPNLGRSVDPTPGARGIFMGGFNPSASDRIDYINIASTGNAIDFGNLSEARYGRSTASRTRALCGSGGTPGYTDRIDFITIATTGDAIDFGNQSVSTFEGGATGNETRGLFAGGYGASPVKSADTIDYVTIATTGDAKDFGNLTFGGWGTRGFSSPTRGIFGCGYTVAKNSGPTIVVNNIINFVTIATLGDATDFGDLSIKRTVSATGSNPVRGVWMGGSGGSPYAATDQIQYIEIASGGNAILFGDLSTATKHAAGCSSRIRAVCAGNPSSATMTYIQIMNLGNSVGFGDLSEARYGSGGTSNDHGGL
jgi:hypothetical protein